MKTRYIFIRCQDYFNDLNRTGNRAWAEFNLYETPNPQDPFRNAFFHFDFYNLFYLKNEIIPEEYQEKLVSQAQERHNAFLNGTEEYMVDLLFYPSGASRLYGAALPAGKTLSSITLNGEKPVYAYLYLRDDAPLTPDTLCKWLEKLSMVLFGDEAQYKMGNG